MKTLKLVLLSLLTVSFFSVSMAQTKKSTSSKNQEITFSVAMDCQSCVQKVEKSIPFEKGVNDVKVDFEGQKVIVKYNANKTNPEALVAAFEKIKLKASPLKDSEKACSKPCTKK